MMNERTSSQRNVTQTPMNPSCRLCHYAGFSNHCTFFRGNECPFLTMKKTVNRDLAETKDKTKICCNV